jgi:hypothetical protein
MRGARQRVAAGERIDQARFADIGAAGERHLHARHRRQRLDRGRGPDELPVTGEEFSALFDQLRIDVSVHAKISVVIARSEATKQSILPRGDMDCFASLAMTGTIARGRAYYVFSTGLPMPNVALRLSNNSTFTPFLRMM